MAVQKENKFFPQLVVPPPQNETELFLWAQNLSRAYEDLSRQIYEKLNAHLDQTHAHPKSWATWKLPRPSFKYSATDKVVVPASATQPVLLKVGENLLEATSDLVCDIDGTGPGGLDTGTKAANTIYYLYGINNSGSAALLASVTAPSTGPTGYSEWTYLGGFVTVGGSQIPEFISTNGVTFSDGGTGWDVTTNNAAPATAKTFLVPVTAKAVYLRSLWSAVALVSDEFLIGPTAAAARVAHRATSTTVNNNTTQYTWTSMLTARTVYTNVTTVTTDNVTARPFGWIEDPTEYP